LFGSGQGFFFLAKSEAYLGGTVVGVIVETGTRDGGYANFFD
jgi:hypothetical protein